MIWGLVSVALAATQPYVPDESVAVKIAEAVAIPIYGEKSVKSEQPFSATLEEGIWNVQGHFKGGPHARGGVVEVKLRKSTGEILEITHGR
jgi:hypothetical protein